MFINNSKRGAKQDPPRGIDPFALRAELARAGIPGFQLAGVLRVSPGRLSNLLHGRLSVDEADLLRQRIETALCLPQNALAPRADPVPRGTTAEAVLARASEELRALALSCRPNGTNGAYCSTIERAAAHVAVSRAELFPSAESEAAADEAVAMEAFGDLAEAELDEDFPSFDDEGGDADFEFDEADDFDEADEDGSEDKEPETKPRARAKAGEKRSASAKTNVAPADPPASPPGSRASVSSPAAKAIAPAAPVAIAAGQPAPSTSAPAAGSQPGALSGVSNRRGKKSRHG